MRPRLAVPRIVAVLALIVALAGAMDLLAASTAQAQDNYKTLTRLGGGNRFDPPLKDTRRRSRSGPRRSGPRQGITDRHGQGRASRR